MPGNELEIVKFLFINKNKISLKRLGLITEIGLPIHEVNKYNPLNDLDELNQLMSNDSLKKADIYLNGKGVSMKQTGACFPYNRAQRADLKIFLERLNIQNVNQKIKLLDDEIYKFHNSLTEGRSKDWNLFFEKQEFKKICNYLMMIGSPQKVSLHPAQYLLEGIIIDDQSDIEVYTFDEYFEKYFYKFKIAFRRQWIGQASTSEHNRAAGLLNKDDNKPWIFENIVGSPRIHRSGKVWRDDYPEEKRKTVYFLMIEKKI